MSLLRTNEADGSNADAGLSDPVIEGLDMPFPALGTFVGRPVDAQVERLWSQVWTELQRTLQENARLRQDLTESALAREIEQVDGSIKELSLNIYRTRVSELELLVRYYRAVILAGDQQLSAALAELRGT